MNKRQKKKFDKNHITFTNRITGKKHTVKLDEFITLLKICDFSEEELEYLLNRMCED